MLELRVIYGDTDQMGVVYYANYLRFFEASRAEFLRQRGWSYTKIEELGVMLPVVEAHVRYRRPAKYEDVLVIDPVVTDLKGATFRFDYTIVRGGELLADGWTQHACLDKQTARPMRMPEGMVGFLRDAMDEARRRSTLNEPKET